MLTFNQWRARSQYKSQGHGHLKMSNNKDNVQFVKDFMIFGSPINQIFVLQAINNLAHAVVEQKEAIRKDMAGSFVSANSWIQAAEKWIREYQENYQQ